MADNKKNGSDADRKLAVLKSRTPATKSSSASKLAAPPEPPTNPVDGLNND